MHNKCPRGHSSRSNPDLRVEQIGLFDSQTWIGGLFLQDFTKVVYCMRTVDVPPNGGGEDFFLPCKRSIDSLRTLPPAEEISVKTSLQNKSLAPRKLNSADPMTNVITKSLPINSGGINEASILNP